MSTQASTTEIKSASLGSDDLSLRECALPLAISALVAGCFAWTGFVANAEGAAPPPQMIGAVAFLLLAAFEDVRRMRIPNVLTFPALAIALVLGVTTGGMEGGLAALSGAGLALALFFPAFVFGWFGAGDVKAMMVFGALFGAGPIVGMSWWMLVVGGLLAIALVGTRPGGLRDLAVRWAKSAWFSLRLRRIIYLKPAQDSVAAAGLPYAVAMGLGASAFQLWGVPWA